MDWKTSRLSQEELGESIEKIVEDVLWDWANYHQYAKNLFPSSEYKKPNLTQCREALRLGKIMCAGVVAIQPSAPDREVHYYIYEFMIGTRLITIGSKMSDFEDIKFLYLAWKPKMYVAQRFHILHYFVHIAFLGKGALRSDSLEFFLTESFDMDLEDDVIQDQVYTLWRGFIEEEAPPTLTASQRNRIVERLEMMKGSKAQKAYERRRAHWAKQRKKGPKNDS